MIFTIGYQAVSLRGLLRIMDEKGVDLLVDVRSVPYSRIPQKYEFNKNRLEETLGERYVWKGDICGGKHGKAKEKCIKEIMEMDRDRTIMLMCMETDPHDCHRFYDIGVRLLEKGIEAYHILPGGKVVSTTDLKEAGDVKKGRSRNKP
jgi:uncharacterized protein (DUF488 family)